MAKVLIALSAILLISLVECRNLGEDECTWGPSYWCSHVQHAKQCKAMDHCISSTWQNDNVQLVASPPCTFCQLMVKNMRHSMQFPSDKNDRMNLMAKTCTVLPASLKAKCKKLVMNNLPEVYHLLESKLNDGAVCAALQLCDTKQSNEVPMKQSNEVPVLVSEAVTEVKAPANDDCADCKAFLGDVQSRLASNTTVAELESELDALVCAQLGPLEDMCKHYLHEYLTVAAKYLHDVLDPASICRLISFCQNGDPRQIAFKMISALKDYKMKPMNGDMECQLCHTAFADLRNMLRDKTIQDAVKNFAENDICAMLGSLQAQCKEYVEAYAPIVFELIVNELDPKVVCSALGFCTNSTLAAASPVLHRVSLLSALSHVDTLTPIRDHALSHVAATPVSASPGCILCEFVMKEVDVFLGANRSQAAVENALNQVCGILPETIRDECKSFVAAYAPAIIELLTQELDPLKVCSALGLCSKKETVVAPKFVLRMPVTKGKSNDLMCDICDQIAGYLLDAVTKKATIDEVRSLLEDVCHRLPETVAQQCVSFVDQYIELIMDLIAQEATPKEMCQALGLCSKMGKNDSRTLYFKKALNALRNV